MDDGKVTLPAMLPLLYLGTGFLLAVTAGLVLIAQVFTWVTTGVWRPASLGILWELAGINGPLAGLPLPGVFLLLGVWLAWEGVKRKPPRA